MQNETSHTILGEHMHCCTVFNLPSHPTICTAVPKKLGGLGEHPSPGELLAATVASCMLSNVAYTGEQKNFPTKGITVSADIAEGTQGVGCIFAYRSLSQLHPSSARLFRPPWHPARSDNLSIRISPSSLSGNGQINAVHALGAASPFGYHTELSFVTRIKPCSMSHIISAV